MVSLTCERKGLADKEKRLCVSLVILGHFCELEPMTPLGDNGGNKGVSAFPAVVGAPALTTLLSHRVFFLPASWHVTAVSHTPGAGSAISGR